MMNNPAVRQIPLALRDLEDCQRSLNNGSKSFLFASYFLPAQVRQAATALYSFCREADDLIDQTDQPQQALVQVNHRIDCIYSDATLDSTADRALRSVVRHYALPRTLLDALIEGFAWDTSGRCYETLDDVEQYAARVAGSVGAMMSVLMGARDGQVLARACDLGVAMQLTNICRDVGEDAANGRCYLPVQWLHEAGASVDDVLQTGATAPLRAVVRRLLQRADVLYKRADCGIAMLPVDCRRGIHMARLVYSAIGGQIQQQGYDSISQRAYVPTTRKLALLAKHVFHDFVAEPYVLQLPSLGATAFLVDAVTDAAPGRAIDIYSGLTDKADSTGDELAAVLQLFDRLEQRKRHDLQANSGRIPLGFAGQIRS
jgi:phytoene synthase